MPVASKDNIILDSGIPTCQSQKLLDLMHRTGYRVIQINGQRRYGGPPPNWSGPAPPKDSEIFVGKIPRNCYEDELVPVFEEIGRIYELRLMMDFSGSNRGYAFVMFSDPETADKAVNELNNFEIRPGRRIGVVKSVNNCRLYIGGLPIHTNQRAIKEVIIRLTANVANIHVNTSNGKNRRTQYAIVEYESHRDAAMARRRLIPDRVQLWGRDIVVDWAAVNTTRNAQRSRNRLLNEDLDLFEEPDISSPTFSLNQQLDKNYTNSSTGNAFTRGLWSLERAMDEELYGISLCDTKSIDRKTVAALEPSVCCPGKMRFLSNLKQVNCVDSNCDTLPSNNIGGLANKVFEGNVNYVSGLHDYSEKKPFLKLQPSVPRLNLSLNETQINQGMEDTFAKIHEDQLSNISGKTLSGLIADLNINCEDTINNYQSFCNKVLENKNYIFNPLMNLSEDKGFDQKGKENVSMLANTGLGYTKQDQVVGNSCAPTPLKRFNRAPGTPVIPSYSATTYVPSRYEDTAPGFLNQYRKMFFA